MDSTSWIPIESSKGLYLQALKLDVDALYANFSTFLDSSIPMSHQLAQESSFPSFLKAWKALNFSSIQMATLDPVGRVNLFSSLYDQLLHFYLERPSVLDQTKDQLFVMYTLYALFCTQDKIKWGGLIRISITPQQLKTLHSLYIQFQSVNPHLSYIYSYLRSHNAFLIVPFKKSHPVSTRHRIEWDKLKKGLSKLDVDRVCTDLQLGSDSELKKSYKTYFENVKEKEPSFLTNLILWPRISHEITHLEAILGQHESFSVSSTTPTGQHNLEKLVEELKQSKVALETLFEREWLKHRRNGKRQKVTHDSNTDLSGIRSHTDISQSEQHQEASGQLVSQELEAPFPFEDQLLSLTSFDGSEMPNLDSLFSTDAAGLMTQLQQQIVEETDDSGLFSDPES